jgi:hypothetical protein
MFYNLKKSGRALQKQIWADTKTSSRSGGIGSSFGIWVARTIFWQPVHLLVKVVDPLSLVYTDVSYNKYAHKMAWWQMSDLEH